MHAASVETIHVKAIAALQDSTPSRRLRFVPRTEKLWVMKALLLYVALALGAQGATTGCILVVITFAARSHAAFNSASFAPRADIPSEGGPAALAFGDVDEDGKLDLVVANYFSSSIAVYRQVGSGGLVSTSSFAPRVSFPTGYSPVQIRLADMDGDGRADIVVANQNYSISVLRNTSTPGVINSNSFAPTMTMSTPGEVSGVAVMDLNGDGKRDLAVSCHNPGVFCLYENNSNPGGLAFGACVNMNVGYHTADVEAGDLDGDGEADLVLSLESPGAVYVYRNLPGQGVLTKSSFALLVWYPAGRNATVTLPDLDGDGRLDLVVANPSENTLSLRRNTSTVGTIDESSFAPPMIVPTASHPFRPGAIDLNRDGRLDIVVANSLSDSVTVLQNLSIPGSLALAPRVDYPTGQNPRMCAVGDLDADGLPDLASASYLASFFSVYRQMPPPPPPPRPQITGNPASLSIPVGGSAAFSVSASGSGLSYHWLFRGTSLSSATSSSLVLTNIAPADGGAYVAIVSNDGGSVTSTVATLNVILPPAPQITTHPASQTVALGDSPVFHMSATGTNLSYQWYFQGLPATGSTSAVLAIRNATFSHAGGYFVTVSNLGGVVTSLVATLTVQFDSNSMYEAHVDVPASTATAGIAFGDLDGDRKPEAIVSNYLPLRGGISVYRNVSVPGRLGTNSFAPFVNFPVGDQAAQILLEDLDGDGQRDIVCVCQYGYSVWLLRNSTTPGVINSNSFATATTLAVMDRPTWAAVADLNGDGKPELIVTTDIGARVLSAFVNNSSPGRLSFGSSTFLTPNADSISLDAGDMDGDGKADIVVCGASSPVVWVFRNIHAGGGIFDGSLAPRVGFPTPTNATLKLADMDGDGKLDIVLVSATENIASVLRNTSTPGVIDTNSFAPRVDFPTGRSPYRPTVGDLNRDGKPDLATANADDDTISVFLNNASPGSFTTASLTPRKDYPTGLGPRAVALEDIDGDGFIDLAAADLSQASFSVLRHARPRPAVLREPAFLGGVFQFEFEGEPQVTCRVEASADLVNWAVLTNFLGASGPLRFQDSSATGGVGRFYRVRAQAP